MALDVVLSVVGVLGVVIAALSTRLRRAPVSEPLLALVAGVVLGPSVTGALDMPSLTEQHELFHEVARLLLAVSVMGIALRYPFGDARRRVRSVAVLVVAVMPLMAAISTGLAFGLLQVSFATALLLGTAMCPTDPVLASSVVTGKPAEEDLPARSRQLLSLESGVNDGLALPLVLLAVAVAGSLTGPAALGESLWKVSGAVGVGVAVGWLAARAFRLGEQHRSMSHGPMLLFTVVLAFAVLGLSGVLALDGILAVFVAGLVFNRTNTGSERTADLEIDEAINRFAVLPLFLMLGAAVPWTAWSDLGWPGPALVLGVLFLRRLPVLLLLKRPLRLHWTDAAYLGWFGPVGVSALFYLTLEARKVEVSDTVLAAGSLVVVASTVAHGLTGSPGRVLYRRLTT